MQVLGICDSQDSGAVLFNSRTGELAAINEERLSRVKLVGGFPKKSIDELLAVKKINPEDIELVAVASYMTPSFLFRSFSSVHAKLRKKNSQFGILLSLYIIYQVFAEGTKFLEFFESAISKVIIKRKLRKLKIDAKVHFVEHHLAHAYAAYSTSGFDKALIFTIDGLGDGISFTVNIGQGEDVKQIYKQNALNDITLYYSRLTEFLGFRPIQDEGKVMGLAAYSENYSAIPQARKLLRSKNGRFMFRNPFFFLSNDRKIYKELKTKLKKDVAASFQKHAEGIICDIVRFWVKKTGISNIALSGGFFANIKANQRIAQMDEVEQVYICPHMGDGGLALGAVFALCKRHPFKLDNIFWAGNYSNIQLQKALDRYEMKYEFVVDIEKRIASLLSRGKVVARFSGAMEYGPRALGNRSILAQATDSRQAKLLNEKLGRDDFMPFAPAILTDDKDKCCIGTKKAEYSASFMNISFNCTEYFKNCCPGAVHRDGTTRPQFVSQDNNSGLYKILSSYKQITGIPAIINTSFNLHEEPIVCSPDDAITSFKKSRLDYLVLNNFLVQGAVDER